MNSWLKETFAALAYRNFRVQWLGGLTSFVAFFMAMIVQSVVAFDISGDNEAVGLVVAGQGFAMAALGPLGGAFADRWPKRRVIAVAQGLTVITFVLNAFLIATNQITIEWLALGSVVIGATLAFLGPARQSLSVELVPREMRSNAMAVSNVANTGARVVGPAVAGALLVWPAVGAVGTYLCMAFLYATSAISLLLLPKSIVREGAQEKPVFADIWEGLRYLAGHPQLRLLVALFVLVILAGFPHVTVLPGLVENVYGLAAADVSVLFVASAIGALSASLFVARFSTSPNAHWIYIGHGLLFGFSLLGLAVAPTFEWLTVGMFLVGFGSGGFQSLNAAVIAHHTDADYMGRVMSLVVIAFAGFGLMSLPYGILADWLGEPRTLLIMGAAVLMICAGFGFLLRHVKEDAEANVSEENGTALSP